MTAWALIDGELQAVDWKRPDVRVASFSPVQVLDWAKYTRRERRHEARKGTTGRRAARRIGVWKPHDIPESMPVECIVFREYRYHDGYGGNVSVYLPNGRKPDADVHRMVKRAIYEQRSKNLGRLATEGR